MNNFSEDLVWITWQLHRRTTELAKALNCRVIYVDSKAKFGLSHILRTFFTVKHLFKHRKKVIIVQNPSRVLAASAAFFKFFFRYKLVVDRHTNFRIGKAGTLDPRIWFVILCSEFSIRYSDLTIVTNSYLKQLVDKKGGYGFVLPDKIPDMVGEPVFFDDSKFQLFKKIVVFICTFADDEPFHEVIESAKLLDDGIGIFITGNYQKAKILPSRPANVIFTGYLSDSDYNSLIVKADAVMDFTDLDWCLVCGGYEAISVGKPFITSDTQALREFYEDSAVYSKHNPDSIAHAIHFCLKNQETYSIKSKDIADSKKADWSKNFSNLNLLIEKLKR